ncbi:hypothetical protein V6N13_074142 [Hibiscus sabdariffa]
MEASLKLAIFFSLLLSSGILFSDVTTTIEAQQKKLKCETNEDFLVSSLPPVPVNSALDKANDQMQPVDVNAEARVGKNVVLPPARVSKRILQGKYEVSNPILPKRTRVHPLGLRVLCRNPLVMLG